MPCLLAHLSPHFLQLPLSFFLSSLLPTLCFFLTFRVFQVCHEFLIAIPAFFFSLLSSFYILFCVCLWELRGQFSGVSSTMCVRGVELKLSSFLASVLPHWTVLLVLLSAFKELISLADLLSFPFVYKSPLRTRVTVSCSAKSPASVPADLN